MSESVAAGAPFPAPRTRPAGTLAGKVAELPSLEVETRQLGGSGQTGGSGAPAAGSSQLREASPLPRCRRNRHNFHIFNGGVYAQRSAPVGETSALSAAGGFLRGGCHRETSPISPNSPGGGVHAAEPDVGQGGRFDLLNGGGRKGGNALSQQPMLGRRILRTRLSGSLPVLRRVREFGSDVSAGAEKGAPS